MSDIEQPPRTGAGSGIEAWREYAKQVSDRDDIDDMKRDEIIAFLDAEDDEFAEVVPAVEPEPEPAPPPQEPEPESDEPAVVELARLRAAARGESYGGVGLVQSALVKERFLAQRYVNGRFGTMTVRAYSKWQRRLGFRGRDASGVPELTSLVRLGDKHGFDVID